MSENNNKLNLSIESIQTNNIIQNIINGLQDPKYSRGGFLPYERFVAMPVMSTILGFAIDGYSAGKMASYRYRAEHQHKKPKTIQQWYFYHKTKNYKVILQSIYSGSKMAVKLSLLSCTYLSIEYLFDNFNNKNSIMSSTLAGLSTSLLVGSIKKLPLQSFKYAVLIGTGFGALTGSLQSFIDYKKQINNESNEE